MEHAPEGEDVAARISWLASNLLGIETYPQTYIVSPRGIITGRIDQAISLEEDVERRLLESERSGN